MKSTNGSNTGNGLFTAVEDGSAIIVRKGSYAQVPLFCRGRQLYVEHTKGQFARLSAQGGTSAPEVRWDEIIVLPIHGHKLTETATNGILIEGVFP